MRRSVGIAAAAAGRRFDEAIESVQSDDRREQRMATVRGDDGLPLRMLLAIDDKRRRAERGETVDGFENPPAGRVGRREGENRKPWPNDSRRPVEHFGG